MGRSYPFHGMSARMLSIEMSTTLQSAGGPDGGEGGADEDWEAGGATPWAGCAAAEARGDGSLEQAAVAATAVTIKRAADGGKPRGIEASDAPTRGRGERISFARARRLRLHANLQDFAERKVFLADAVEHDLLDALLAWNARGLVRGAHDLRGDREVVGQHEADAVCSEADRGNPFLQVDRAARLGEPRHGPRQQ